VNPSNVSCDTMTNANDSFKSFTPKKGGDLQKTKLLLELDRVILSIKKKEHKQEATLIYFQRELNVLKTWLYKDIYSKLCKSCTQKTKSRILELRELKNDFQKECCNEI